jgi:hypothetical protein
MEELAALRLATELKLINEDDARLAAEMLSKGISFHADSRQWLTEIETKIKEQVTRLNANPYQRYLIGGPKPRRSDGRPDWDAKDQHQLLSKQLHELETFFKDAKDRINPESPQTYSPAFETAIKLMGVIKALLALPVSSQSITFTEDADDLRLCLAWSNTPEPKQGDVTTSYLRQLIGGFDAGRLISARLAERSAANYYRLLDCQVADVSILQLDHADERWKKFDLLVDGRPIDVKNSRRSFTSPEAYVQHCVPQFKTLREDGEEVIIVGVLSEYLQPEELVSSHSNCRILGETSFSKILKLRSWAANRFGRLLRLDGMWRPDYQPGWVFEYPVAHYRSRNEAIREISSLLQKLQAYGIPKAKIPSWLLTLCPDRSLALSMARPGLESAVLTDLYSLDDVVGLTRPALFILIIGLFAEAMAHRGSAGALELTLRDLILVKTKPDYRPLGLEDPQSYISSVIACLARVCSEAVRQGMQFQAFRITHPAILRGEREDGRWMTLIAYCGGWIEQPFKVRCGASPLFFGEHEACPECGYLVCNTCGFCSQQCHRGYLRKRQIAAQNRSIIDEEYYF